MSTGWFEGYVESKKAIVRNENFNKCIEEAQNNGKKLLEKIKELKLRKPHLLLSAEEIRAKIAGYYEIECMEEKKLVNFMISTFEIDPAKQNFYEKEMALVLQNKKEISNIRKGTHWYPVENEFKKLSTKAQRNGAKTKSVDYIFNIGVKKYFVSMKYIKDEGGAQDNQYNDLVGFLESSKLIPSENVVVIVAGKHFTKDRIKKLELINLNAFVKDINEIDAFISSELSKQRLGN